MNIFYLDHLPMIAAREHCDRHVVKMILETAQLLSTTVHLLYPHLPGRNEIYKPTHCNHPCALWARESHANWSWLHRLGSELCIEYIYRYNKLHKSSRIIELCNPANYIVSMKLDSTEPPLAMPEEYKVPGDPVQSYRNYYIGAKKHLLTYTNRSVPYWVRANNLGTYRERPYPVECD